MASILLSGRRKMGYLYSAKTNSFYPAIMQNDYERSGTWPDDVVPVTDNVYLEFTGIAPSGKIRSAGTDGLPEWVQESPPDQLALVEQAELQKAVLRAAADNALAPLSDAVELGIATEQEKERYDIWRMYRVMLNRVNTSQAPDISWPELPED